MFVLTAWLGVPLAGRATADATWSSITSIGTARQDHTATTLLDGRLLVAGGHGGSAALAGAELFDPSTGTWAATGSLASARHKHTATLLRSGRVLVVGGMSGGGALASTELYDPATGAWTSAGLLADARASHTAVRLFDGRVLVAGGTGDSGIVGTAALFDEATGWSPTASLLAARELHTATLLGDGRVLIAGGRNGSALATAERFDPDAGTWTSAGSLGAARYDHTATLLPGGKVLVTGGSSGSAQLSTSELFDPASGSWSAAASAGSTRERHTATLLPDGRLVVGGGYGTAGAATNACTSAITGGQTLSGSLAAGDCASQRRAGQFADYYTFHAAAGDQVSISMTDVPSFSFDEYVYLDGPDGRLIGSGSGSISTTTLPSTGFYRIEATAAWTPVSGSNNYNLTLSGTATPPPGSPGLLTSAEAYDPSTDSWSWSPSPAVPRSLHTASILRGGAILLAGGQGASGALSNVERYEPRSGSWTNTARLDTSRENHTATLVPSGKVLVAGGQTGGIGAATVLSSAILYDPSAGTWSATGAMAAPRHAHTATLLPNGKVLAAAGVSCYCYGALLSSADLYDTATGTWAPTGQLGRSRAYHKATLLADGKVMVCGGTDNGSPGENLGPGGSPFSDVEIYDPSAGTWSTTGSMTAARYLHTATLLADGKVLVVGGGQAGTALSSAELYDPSTRTWSATGALVTARRDHSATLMADGRVLVVGGQGAGILSSAEIYDPATGTWSPTGSLAQARFSHMAILLPSGSVLVAGGYPGPFGPVLSTTELYDPLTGTWASGRAIPDDGSWGGFAESPITLLPSGKVLLSGGNSNLGGYSGIVRTPQAVLFDPGGYRDDRRPVITSDSGPVAYGGSPFTLTGTRLGGDSEASGGRASSSPANHPYIQVRSIEGGAISWLQPDALPDLPFGPATLSVSSLPSNLNLGWSLLTVFGAGVPSLSRAVEVITCALSLTEQPASQTVARGSTVTLSVTAQGGRTYQWQKDGVNIPGATARSYTTPPLSAAESGSRYRCVVGGACGTNVISDAATLTIQDDTSPTVTVAEPGGGEYWLLSEPGAPPRTETVSWSMSDDIRICRVEASLWYSTDGGATYVEAPAGGGFPASFGPGGTCANPGEGTTNLTYTVPADFPSGVSGSLYKVQVRVTDHAGLAATVRSANPFYIVQPNPDSVRTLILSNVPRMLAAGVSPGQASLLSTKLQELAAHPKVQGLVVDLGGVTDVTALYGAWDADASNPDKANQVLFGCHTPLPSGCAAERNGVHDTIRALLQVYTGVKYVVVVGDDRIIPFARLQDRTLLLPESAYTSGPDLTASGTTVGQALAANKYLSDDPLGVVDAVRPESLSTALYIPDLAVGRLVETPEEITAAIATFISQDGVLDLSVLNPTTGHRVLVTGYDFLTDSAKQIRQRWKTVFGADPDPYSLSPVDGELVGGTWGLGSVSARVNALATHLSGNGGARYGVSSLSGHANHYQEGVPGTSPFDIDGLDASSIASLNLAGGVIYAVGCHGGLAVPGSNPSDADHSLDLPQTFLSRGVVAYVANTGFGWGLKHGIGYGERLVQLLTEDMTRGGTVITGEAVKRTKQKYYLESPRFDAYDQKSLMQWTLFGLPMYGVKTGLTSLREEPLEAVASHARPALERIGPVRVKRSGAGASASTDTQAALPSSLTQLNLHFDFTAPGVYRKWTASGDDVTASSPNGCPDANGCYYTLNGLVERAGGMTDLPVQPYFIYDSRLSGTSQHGVIWKGGVYEQESGWVPILGELQSNGGDGSEHGPLPEEMTIDVVTTRTVPGQDPDQCRPSELELNSLVVNAGEALKDQGTGLYSIERKYREIDLEVFYFNDTVTSTNNCDRVGPAFGSGPHHSVSGTTVQFAVPATDASGVWRVLVVYNKNTLDGQNRGRWEPLELTNDGGVWRGSVALTGVSKLTYMLQAVDNRGNVSWLRFESAELPASGVPLGIPLAVRVSLVSPTGSGSLIDYDRDNRSDHTVFHSASGTWYLRNSTTGAVSAVGYGGPGYTVVPGDYDGDGITDLGAYHPPSGLWFIRNSTTMSTTTTGFGGPDYKPVRGDFDGDGKTDLAVFHDPTGLWFIKKSSTGTVDTIGYGASGYVPVPADYDGDGKTDLAVYHPPTGLWFTRASSTLTTTTTGFGGTAYKPVRGDFDGDGKDDIAVYHEPSGLWFIKNSSTATVTPVGYGGPGYTPVPGKYDADLKTDIAVYHEPSGLWFMKSSLTGASTAVGFGGSGYLPVN